MKLLRMVWTSVLIFLFILVGLCFGQKTDDQDLVKDIEHACKWKFEKVKEGFEKKEVTHPSWDSISQEDFTGSFADIDDSKDDIEKRFNELIRQFEEFSKDLKRIPESEEFHRFVRELERLQEELKRGGESVKEKFEKEIIPRLQEEIEKLKKRFLKPRDREVEEPIEV